MNHEEAIVRKQSLDLFASSIRKLGKDLTSVQQNVASTTVVSKRLQALKSGLAALQIRWENQGYPYSAEETKYGCKCVLFPLN
jgi:hypothetical protein